MASPRASIAGPARLVSSDGGASCVRSMFWFLSLDAARRRRAALSPRAWPPPACLSSGPAAIAPPGRLESSPASYLPADLHAPIATSRGRGWVASTTDRRGGASLGASGSSRAGGEMKSQQMMRAAVLHRLGETPRYEPFPAPLAADGEAVTAAALKP